MVPLIVTVVATVVATLKLSLTVSPSPTVTNDGEIETVVLLPADRSTLVPPIGAGALRVTLPGALAECITGLVTAMLPILIRFCRSSSGSSSLVDDAPARGLPAPKQIESSNAEKMIEMQIARGLALRRTLITRSRTNSGAWYRLSGCRFIRRVTPES